MAIMDSLNAARARLEEIVHDYRFQRANLNREEKIALQAALAKCRGKLEVCQKDFARIVREQSKNIREGQSIGADTLVQEQMLWDAAIGYMLVRDAIFSMKTINTHQSVAHAYEMMDLATRQMSGKKSGLPLKTVRDRNVYGYVTSEAAYKEKEELLDSFFEQLKSSGDIEECLSHAQHPSRRESALRDAYTKDAPLPSRETPDDNDDPMRRLRDQVPQAAEEHDFTDDTNPMLDGINYGGSR